MTPEQAAAWGELMNHAKPLVDAYFAHTQRVNDQQRQASRPAMLVAGGIAAAVSLAGVVAMWRGDSQLARDLLLPLLTFAGGLGLAHVNQPKG